jgi:3-deoxy-D-manno-octulosonic-acid transferase
VNSLLRIPYTAAGTMANALTRVVPAGQSKFRRGVSARRDIVARYERWAKSSRVSDRPLLWFHAPSVGEGLQAAPVLELVRARIPEVQIVYTFYSPSAEKFATALQVDFVDYLPFDTYGDARRIISALRPTALVFSKLDVWPALTESAARAGVNVGVISATLPQTSGRRGFFARSFLTDAYSSLACVGAIDAQDAELLREQGVHPERVIVTGDTRYDQVRARAHRPPSPLVQSLRTARPTLVAGSTWPSDETHLLAAWRRICEKIPDARLIIAPHELTDDHLRSITEWAAGSHLTLALLDSPGAPDADVVLVDRYGVLGDLYALADVAYVGGGFHAAGLHSVLEPAAFGAPVLFGPRISKSRDAQLVQSSAGGAVVTGSADLAIRLSDWLGSPSSREIVGEAAREMVERGCGAAERSFELVRTLLNQPPA